MSNLNLKGLWIPIEILTDKNLSDKGKHIYSLVIFLSQEKQYCFCTNKTISELLNISVTQVSKLVNSLPLTIAKISTIIWAEKIG